MVSIRSMSRNRNRNRNLTKVGTGTRKEQKHISSDPEFINYVQWNP